MKIIAAEKPHDAIVRQRRAIVWERREPNKKLEQVMTEDFKNETDFDYNLYRKFYLNKATKFFEGFRENCENKKLLQKISTELDWQTDI